MKPPFLMFDVMSSNGGTGHVGFILHKQPELERAIRDSILQSPCSELRPDSTLMSIEENAEVVKVAYNDAQGVTRQIRAQYLVGADGKTGYVRKRYLEPKGIVMEKCEGYACCARLTSCCFR